MDKKTKNPSQKLSNTDKEILNKVISVYMLLFYTLTQLYPDPKKIVEKMIKKWLATHKIARYHTAAYAGNAPFFWSNLDN
jgi:hypothetical protein